MKVWKGDRGPEIEHQDAVVKILEGQRVGGQRSSVHAYVPARYGTEQKKSMQKSTRNLPNLRMGKRNTI